MIHHPPTDDERAGLRPSSSLKMPYSKSRRMVAAPAAKPYDPVEDDTSKKKNLNTGGNHFLRFKNWLGSALRDPDTYNISSVNDRIKIAGRLWYTLAEMERDFWKTATKNDEARSSHPTFDEASEAERRHKQNRLGNGETGFDRVPLDLVLEALRFLIRCLVDPDLDPHMKIKSKRQRKVKEDEADAKKFNDLRKSLYKKWRHRLPEDYVLQPVFTLDDLALTDADIEPFLGRDCDQLRLQDCRPTAHDYMSRPLLFPPFGFDDPHADTPELHPSSSSPDSLASPPSVLDPDLWPSGSLLSHDVPGPLALYPPVPMALSVPPTLTSDQGFDGVSASIFDLPFDLPLPNALGWSDCADEHRYVPTTFADAMAQPFDLHNALGLQQYADSPASHQQTFAGGFHPEDTLAPGWNTYHHAPAGLDAAATLVFAYNAPLGSAIAYDFPSQMNLPEFGLCDWDLASGPDSSSLGYLQHPSSLTDCLLPLDSSA